MRLGVEYGWMDPHRSREKGTKQNAGRGNYGINKRATADLYAKDTIRMAA